MKPQIHKCKRCGKWDVIFDYPDTEFSYYVSFNTWGEAIAHALDREKE